MKLRSIDRYLLSTAVLFLAPGFLAATPTEVRTQRPSNLAFGSGVPSPACEDGVVKDDGSLETGYGWVPSVVEGEYVQVFDRSEFPSNRLQTVCVCWLRTRTDDSIDFEVVFYGDAEGQPAATPFAVVPASTAGLPQGVPEGRFSAVDVSGVEIPDGVFYIGPRWDASADQFFFVCGDTTPETAFTNTYFRDDRSKGEWANALDTNDPIFQNHRAILVRAVGAPAVVIEIPTLDYQSMTALALLLLTAAWTLDRRR